MNTSGILLFAHGARDPRGHAVPQAVAHAWLQQQPGTPAVKLAFLEFMSPDIAQAGAELAAQGCSQVTVVPLFLGAGGHVLGPPGFAANPGHPMP